MRFNPLALCLLPLLTAYAEPARAACPPFLLPETRPFSHEAYGRSLLHWKALLIESPATYQTLERGGWETGESLLALGDALHPEGPTFLGQIAAIEKAGGKVLFRGYRFPLFHAAPEVVYRRGQWHGLPLLRRESRAIVLVTQKPPPTLQAASEWLLKLAAALEYQRLSLATQRAGFLTKLWGTQSFSTTGMQTFVDSEHHVYSVLRAFHERFPTTVSPLPKRDATWKWRQVQYALEWSYRWIAPFYRPLGKHYPNQVLSTAARDGHLEEELEKRYGPRLKAKWVIDHYRQTVGTFFLGVALLSAADLARVMTSADVREGWARIQAEIQSMEVRLKPARLNPALDAYQDNQAGFSMVNDRYNALIRDLKERIRSEGDPQGKLQLEIQKWETRRDELNH